MKRKLGAGGGGGAKMGRRLLEFITRSSSNKYTVTAAAAFTALSLIFLVTILSPISYLPLRFPFSGARFPHQTCASRQQRDSYLKYRSPELPPYLLSKLSDYERLHRRCGPLSESFQTTLPLATQTDFSSSASADGSDCKFLVYTPSQGLGNRILGLTSTFLYALLTDRVLLVDFSSDMGDLFCEPFPHSTWILPGNFPLRSDFYSGRFRDVYSYGKLLEKKEITTSGPSTLSPSPLWNSTLLQIFLDDKYNDYDKLFFKDEKQGFLEKIPWLVLISDGYFVPCLFQMQSFRSELEKLFPNKSTVFHQLGNYLLAPSNQAWKLITEFYDAHLAKAEQRIGIQVRVFDPKATPTPVVMKQILSCTEKQRILPQLQQPNETSKAVLVASLSSEFYDEIKNTFGGGGGGIEVYQASHEETQQSYKSWHNMKAWADIYLLSMSDVLVTSGMSTFGYVAAGIGGVRPWIVTVPDPKDHPDITEWAGVCERAVNLEPCFHFPPWFAYPDQQGTAAGGIVNRCEDVPWGLKLVTGLNRTEVII